MNKIVTNKYPKFKQDCFVHIMKNVGQLQVGKIYTFVEFPDKHFIRMALCVDVQNIELQEITNHLSHLDMNCDLEIYREIMESRLIGDTSMLSVGTFTIPSNSKNYYYERISK